MAVDQSISEARLKDEALSELGLTEQPFVENKKLSRFSDSVTQKIRASLEQKLRFGHTLHLLTGDKGVGKSVFLSQLFKHCKSNIKPFVAKGDDNFSSLAFLAAVQYQLTGEAEEYDSVHDYVDALTPQFENLADDKMSVVLAIDDAHNAPVEEIAELINLMPEFINDSDEPTARLLLAGEPELAEELNALADEFDEAAYDPTNTILTALDETRIPDYLSSRLKQVGFTDAFPFTDKAITKIQRESGGLPGKVNASATDYLNKVYAAPANEAGGAGFLAALGWPLVALGAAAVGLIAWGLSLFFVGNEPDPIVRLEPSPAVTTEDTGADDSETALVVSSSDTNEPDNSSALITNNDPLASVTAGAQTPAADEPLIVGGTESTGQTAVVDNLLKPEDQPDAQAIQNEAEVVETVAEAITDTATETQDQVTETVTEIVEAPDLQVADTAQTTAESAQNTAQEQVSDAVDTGNELLNTVNDTVARRAEQISADVESTGIAIADNTSTESEQLAQSIGQGTAQALPESVEVIVPGAVDTVSEPVELPETDSDAASVSTEPDNGGITVPVQPALTDSNGISLDIDAEDAVPAIQRAVENERWVLFQDAGKFTVQLATSREREYIIGLAQTLPALDPVAIYPFLTSNSKNPVFGLLSGLYDTREEALAAVATMPEAAKQFGTWIRPIGDLQGDIKSNE